METRHGTMGGMMQGLAQWVLQHGKDSLQVVGIVAGLAFTALGLRADTRSRRVQTLITLTQQHRDIWEEITKRPALRRVVDPAADVVSQPVTPDEERFVGFVILHIHCWYRAERAGEISPLEGAERDLRDLFALPVAAQVWERRRPFLDGDFVRFIDQLIEQEVASWAEPMKFDPTPESDPTKTPVED